MIRFFKMALLWGLFFAATLSGRNASVVVHIFFTESTNGILTNCMCPAQPYGGLARRKTLLDSLKWHFPYSIILDAGNFLTERDIESNQEKIIHSMSKINYDAIHLGIHDIQYLKFHPASNSENELTFIDSGNQVPGSHDLMWFNIQDYHILILDEMFSETISISEMDILSKKANLIILLSKTSKSRNKSFIDAYPDKVHMILGNGSESPVLGNYEMYQNSLLASAGVDGNSVGHIQVHMEDGKVPQIENILFHKVNKDIFPDAEIESIINSRKGDQD